MIIIDSETNGLLFEATQIHCISFRELESNKEILIVGQDETEKELRKLIQSKENIIGQNIFTYDNEVFKKLLGIDLTKTNKVIDTFIMSQVLCANLKNEDFGKWKDKLPKKLIGSHSLEAWGYRLDCHKGVYTGGFEEYNDEMGIYCTNDTLATRALYLYLESLIGDRTWR